MKTLMKISWMLSLLGFSLAFGGGCKKNVDSEFTAEYIYYNKSNSYVEFILMGDILLNNEIIGDKTKTYSIAPNDSISFNITLPTNSKIGKMPQNILKQNNLLGDSVQINFDSGKTLKFLKDESGNDSIYLESNYSYSKLGDYAVRFEFNIQD